MAAELSLKVDGVWLDRIGWWGGVEVEKRWPFGPYALSWEMALEPGDRPPALMPKAGEPPPLVEAFCGSRRHWTGRLLDCDWATGTFAAEGLAREGETALAFDYTVTDGLFPTLDPGPATFFANARGAVSWGSLETFGPITDEPATEPNYIASLLDAWSEKSGRRWAVNPDFRLYTGTDPTAPHYMVYPSVADLGATREGKVDAVYGRFLNSLTLKYQTAVAGSGQIEEIVDLTRFNDGRMTPAQANEILTAYLSLAGNAWNFTNGLTLTHGMVTTPGGSVVDMADVAAGRMIRVYGCRDPRNGRAYTDFVIGTSIWTCDEGVVQANPLQMVGRDEESMLEDIASRVLA